MVPSQSRSRHRTFGQKLPKKTQPPSLDAVLERLHKIFGFPLPHATTGKKASRDAYISKLESLLKLDLGCVNNTIASLELMAQQLENGQHSTRTVQKLMAKFDELLENELSQLRDDRDRSILDLIGLTSGEEGDVELKVGIVKKKQQADEAEYDGRFDDPVTEHPSPAASADRASTHPCWNINAFVSCISELASKSTNTLLPSGEGILHQGGVSPDVSNPSLAVGKWQEQQNTRYLDGIRVSLEIPADSSDSDESFYSCSRTSENLPGENIEAGNTHFRPNSTNSGDTVHTLHHSTPKPEFVQKTSYPRVSQKGKESSLSPNPPRKFHLSQFPRSKQWDCEQHMQSALGTNPTCSAESSFSASSSFSNRLGTDWSPPTSLETSFNEDTESLTRPTKQKGPRLAIVAEVIDETKFLGDGEAPYNGDCDSEATDIDDSDVSYEQSRVIAKMATRPSEKRPLPQRNVSIIPKPDGRKFGQPNQETREEEAAFQKLAEEFFGDEYGPNPLAHTFMSVNGTRPVNGHAVCIREGGGAQEGEDSLLGEIGEEGFAGEWDNINNTLELADETQEQCDDEGVQEGEDPLLGEIGEEGFAGEWDNVDNTLELADETQEQCDDEGAQEGEDPLLGEIGEEGFAGELDNINNTLELADETQEQCDDEDEFGAIDPSFVKAFSNFTALKSTSHPLPTLHFAIQHEATRVALNEGPCSNDAICDHLHGYCDDLYEAKEYHDVWKTLTQFSEAAKHLEQTAESVWSGFKEGRGWPDNVYLTGTVHCGKTPIKGCQPPSQGPSSIDVPWTITLNPLSRTKGNRFYNRFGSDRFLHLGLPPLSRQSGLPDKVLQQRLARITDWLADEEIVLMNRTWKFFYMREKTSGKKSNLGKTMQAVFFAVRGVGIGDSLSDQEMNTLGFKKSDKKIRQEMDVEELLQWHIPLNGNLDMSVPKFWSRISLGFSTSTPTITFELAQIEYVDDIISNIGEVMNDGCSVVSPAVMQIVRQKLGLLETPTAVQARLGGAKGVWMVDPAIDLGSEKVYIKVTKSQSKYKGYSGDADWARLTLDVLTTSHDPTPATINIQLIPILEDRGVPFETLRELLEEHLERDLEELFCIIDEPSELRRWMYDRGNVGKDRMAARGVATCGGVPASRSEIAIMLLESGFLVRECNFLMTQVRKTIDQYCDDLKTKLRVKIPNSTTLLCVADPTGTLREGEVSLRFSNGILDLKTMRRSSVIIGDILVARNPAHLPSDIQRVKAVDLQYYHSPGLRELKDVIVFSVQGNRSLASLLSGGDYDGDKPWICWDNRLVEPFRNSPSTFAEFEKPALLCFERSPTNVIDLKPHQQGFFNRFIRAGIANSLEDDFLGLCTNIWEKHCYACNSISDPKAIELAKLCSILVDAPKQGLSILPSKREEITKLGYRYIKPAYRELKSQSQGVHVIDRLHYDVAGQKIMEKQVAFHNDVGESPSYEPLITEVFHRETNRAKEEGPEGTLARTLKHLSDELAKIRQAWYSWRSEDNTDQFKSSVMRLRRQFRGIMPPKELSEDPVISRWVSDRESYFSHWDILRASAAYHNWRGAIVWYMAGHELCYIKAHAMLAGSDFGPRTIVEELYLPMKASKRFGRKATAMDDEERGWEEEDGSVSE